jgi:uncharacterized cupin superfamily protein
MDLDDWGLPKGVEIEGEPRLKGRILWRADDGRQLIGVQRCDPCTMRGTHLGELAVIAEGRLTVRQEGLADRKVGVGDALIYEEGTTDEWVVHEPLCKVFFLHAREPIEF